MSPRKLSCSRTASGLAFAVAATLACPVPARAQYINLASEEAGAPDVGHSKSSKGSERLVPDTGHIEVAGEMAFLTSSRSPFGPRLALTDAALLRLDLRRSFANWFQLAGGTELLVKQPTTTHAPLVQGLFLGAQAEFAKGFGALLGGAAGPLVGAKGRYYAGGPGLCWKPSVGRYLRFVVGVGNQWTLLDFDPSTQESFFLGEAVAGGETQIGDEKASIWIGIDYAVPFAKNPGSDAPDPVRGYLDPQVRVNLEAGGALNVGAEDWNVYVTYTVVDRGEHAKPQTMLPILDRGFDQQQLVVGVEYRFSPKPSNDASEMTDD